MEHQRWSWEGIQLIWVVLGILGAALGIGSMPPMSKKQCWTALGSGCIFAGLGPQWLNHAYMYWFPTWINPAKTEMPGFMLGSFAFVCGVGGLFLIPAIVAFWKDPRGFLVSIVEFVTTARARKGDVQ
jgi:hypothetical protein